MKPLIHRWNGWGVGACGAREFDGPVRHKFSQRQSLVTCPKCKARKLRVVHFTQQRRP